MNVIDLFSGVGGFSSGFKKAGYDILLANEIDPMIAESYRMNHKGTLMINRDIKDIVENTNEIIQEELITIEDDTRKNEIIEGLKKVDVIIGGPPCQGFSMAGARIRKNKDEEFIDDPRNYLFKYYFKMIQKYEPNYFIMENVQGLETMKNGSILEEIINLFTNANNFKKGKYHLSRMVIAANTLGVPQSRKRLIIIGSKFESIDIENELKRIRNVLNIPEKVTVQDAIGDLMYLESNEGSFESQYLNKPSTEYQRSRRGNNNILYNHVAPKHNKVALDRIKLVEMGGKLEDRNIKSVHSGAYGRLDLNEVAPTITTRFDTPSAGRVIHPLMNRALTPREAARLQSFDDDFVFYGNKTSIGKQIGNAVPPLVAEVLAKIILNDYRKKKL